MRRHTSLVLPALALALSACGGAATEPEPSASTNGGEEVVTVAEPIGPPPSFLAQGTKVQMRIDVARIRRSPLAPDISSAIRASTTWQALAGSSGADPIQDFDAILVGGDALYTDRRVVVLRHPHTEAEVRRRVLQMAVDRGTIAEWHEVAGLPAVSWPMQRVEVPYSLVITAEHELVLAADDDLERIAAVARDHALRRAAPTDAIEPQLVMRAGEIATAIIDVPLPGRTGYPEPPQRTLVQVDERDGDGAAVIAIHSEFTTDAQSTAAHAWLDQQAAFYAQQTMVRAIGMNRPIEEARFAHAGTGLDIGASLTTDELRRALGLMALSQLAGR